MQVGAESLWLGLSEERLVLKEEGGGPSLLELGLPHPPDPARCHARFHRVTKVSVAEVMGHTLSLALSHTIHVTQVTVPGHARSLSHTPFLAPPFPTAPLLSQEVLHPCRPRPFPPGPHCDDAPAGLKWRDRPGHLGPSWGPIFPLLRFPFLYKNMQ